MKEVLEGYRVSSDFASRIRVREAVNSALQSLPDRLDSERWFNHECTQLYPNLYTPSHCYRLTGFPGFRWFVSDDFEYRTFSLLRGIGIRSLDWDELALVRFSLVGLGNYPIRYGRIGQFGTRA